MEYIIGLIALLFGGLYFYKKKADKAEVEAILAETEGKDSVLEELLNEAEKEAEELDKDLEILETERSKQREERESKSREDRADEWSQ